MNGFAWEERIDAPDLAWARIGVGLAAMAEGVYATMLFDKATTPGVLRVPVADWLPAPGVFLALLLGGIWLVASGGFIAGVRTRTCGVALAATMAFTIMWDRQFYSSHLYLLSLLVVLLTVANAGGYRSVDARAGEAPDASPAWAVFLVRGQVSIVYLFTALATVQLAYASEATLAASLRDVGPLAFPAAWRTPDVVAVFAVAYIGTALWLATALWSARRRRTATIVGVAFHAALIAVAADALGFAILGLAMVSAYAAFYVPLPTAAYAEEMEPQEA
ncbi:MAG TPA: HTTM domain-containing protein [Longimicrobiales bacterium]|nr:HTTM domain-containing protein [Longimicrobiales bacterium]